MPDNGFGGLFYWHDDECLTTAPLDSASCGDGGTICRLIRNVLLGRIQNPHRAHDVKKYQIRTSFGRWMQWAV